jgi:hypothetical protein
MAREERIAYYGHQSYTRSCFYNIVAAPMPQATNAFISQPHSSTADTKLVVTCRSTLAFQEGTKAKKRAQASLGSKFLLTDIDFLLNTGRFDRAYNILQHITEVLAKANSSTEA